MKALKYILILAAAPMLWACSADEGTRPGADLYPEVTLYTYTPTGDYNPDNDVKVRFVTNNMVTEVRYLVLPSSEVENIVKKEGEDELLKKVEKEGLLIDELGAYDYADIILTDIHGDYSIAAVAYSAEAHEKKLGNMVSFTGLSWDLVKQGTFIYNNNIVPAVAGIESVEASLEICTTDSALYRINGVFGAGTSVKMNMLKLTGEDEDGKYQYFRVKPTDTPWAYGNYGTMFVQDIGYWQGNEAWVTSNGYESGLYEDGSAFFYLAWCVSAGYIGYNYSYFIPYE